MLTDDLFLGTKLYSNKLLELCKPINQYLGTDQAAYAFVDKNGATYCISSNVKMMEDSIEKQGYKNATFLVSPKNMHNGFAFDNACTNELYKNINLYTYVNKFNWHNSFIYTEKNNDGAYVAFNFATTKENFSISNRLINEHLIIKKLIRDLNNKVTSIFHKDITEHSMNFPELRGESFYTTKGRVFNENFEIEKQNKIKLLQESGIFDSYNNDCEILSKIRLSPQELNCLRIYQTTHSIKKVAMDLSLAASTVTSYIENIKDKFNCNNKNELFEKVEILASLGHIYL